MTPYATITELEEWAFFLGVETPRASEEHPDPRERLLRLATADLQRHLGTPWDPSLLLDVQAQALADACAIQALFRAGQGTDQRLGQDDGVASVGGVTFSTRQPVRMSPEAVEAVAGVGLYARSHTLEVVFADGEEVGP